MKDSKDHKISKTQVHMTPTNFKRYETLVIYYYGTTPGPRLGILAVEDLNKLEERVLADKAKGLLPPEKNTEE